MRNAPVEQLIRGVRKIVLGVVKKPLVMRESGACLVLLRYKRNLSRFHPRAEKVLWILMDSSIIRIGDKSTQGSGSIAEVVVIVFQRNTKRTVLQEQFLYNL